MTGTWTASSKNMNCLATRNFFPALFQRQADGWAHPTACCTRGMTVRRCAPLKACLSGRSASFRMRQCSPRLEPACSGQWMGRPGNSWTGSSRRFFSWKTAGYWPDPSRKGCSSSIRLRTLSVPFPASRLSRSAQWPAMGTRSTSDWTERAFSSMTPPRTGWKDITSLPTRKAACAPIR